MYRPCHRAFCDLFTRSVIHYPSLDTHSRSCCVVVLFARAESVASSGQSSSLNSQSDPLLVPDWETLTNSNLPRPLPLPLQCTPTLASLSNFLRRDIYLPCHQRARPVRLSPIPDSLCSSSSLSTTYRYFVPEYRLSSTASSNLPHLSQPPLCVSLSLPPLALRRLLCSTAAGRLALCPPTCPYRPRKPTPPRIETSRPASWRRQRPGPLPMGLTTPRTSWQVVLRQR